jgi:hypothetical protein
VVRKAFEHATDFFEALNAAATTESVNGKNVRVFRGSVVEVFRSLGISQAHYSEVRAGLINSECVTIIQQGARGVQSIVVLHHPPVENGFGAPKDNVLTKDSEAAILIQQLNDVKRLIGSINIPEALINFEQRLTELDKRVTQIEQQSQGRID